MSVKEIITVCVGEAGINVGHRVWLQYCAQHGLSPSQTIMGSNDDNEYKAFFHEMPSGFHINQYKIRGNKIIFGYFRMYVCVNGLIIPSGIINIVAQFLISIDYNHDFQHNQFIYKKNSYVFRNISIDMDREIINNLKSSKYGTLYDHNYLLDTNDISDGGNCFARGFMIPRDMTNELSNKFRLLSEKCDQLQGFIINNSLSGGTGSGLSAKILDDILVPKYPKTERWSNIIMPTPNICQNVVEPYNSILHMHYNIPHIDLALSFDNNALYNICKSKLNIPIPSYTNINNLIAKAVALFTLPIRRGMNTEMNSIKGSMVAYPPLHFMTPSISPISTDINKTNQMLRPANVLQVLHDSLDPTHFFTDFQFDSKEDKFAAVNHVSYGDIRSIEISVFCQWIKANKIVEFIENAPTGLKFHICNHIIKRIDNNDDFPEFPRGSAMFGNCAGIKKLFQDRMLKRFNEMYNCKSYLHWYINEGLELSDFNESKQSMIQLLNDYNDSLNDQPTDSDDDDE